MRVAVREKTAIEGKDAANFRAAFGFAARVAVEPATQVLEDYERREVEGDERCGADAESPPNRLDEVGALGSREAVVVAWRVGIAHPDIVEEQLRHGRRVRQMGQHLRPAARAIREAGEEAEGVRDVALAANEDP